MSPASICSTASVSSAARNAGSRSTRALIVSLKLRVSGIASFLSSAPPVISPSGQPRGDIVALALLRTSAQQNDQRVTIASEIHAVARTEVDPTFLHATSNALAIGQVALLEPPQGRW